MSDPRINRADEAQVLQRILVIVGCLAVALLLGRMVGQGRFLAPAVILGGGVFAAIVLALGHRYWLLVPFSLCINVPLLPVTFRNIEVGELVTAGCALVFAARVALKVQPFRLFQRDFLGILLYLGWIGVVFAMNPVGFFVLGSETGGARFYLKLGLAFAAVLIVSNQTISSRDCRWIFVSMLAASSVNIVVSAVPYLMQGSLFFLADPSYTWHQTLAIPAYYLILFLLIRYSPFLLVSFFSPPFWAFGAAMAMAWSSGKRAVFGTMLLAPAVVAFVRKQYRFLVPYVALAIAGIAFVVVTHGTFYRLPVRMQRVFGNLPGKWDPEVNFGGVDSFRHSLRSIATDIISRNPWLGKKGYGVNLDELYSALLEKGATMDAFIAMMAIGSQWHNTWLGFAADFGIPASVFWAIFLLQAVRVGYLTQQQVRPPDWRGNLAGIFFLIFVFEVAKSWTSGHSALTPYGYWWMYGVLVALRRETTPAPVAKPAPARGSVTRAFPRTVATQRI